MPPRTWCVSRDAPHVDADIDRRIGLAAEAEIAEIGLGPRDEHTGPGCDVGLEPPMREAFVWVLEQRQTEHRKCGHGNDRDVLIGLEERRVESETEPVETVEPPWDASIPRL